MPSSSIRRNLSLPKWSTSSPRKTKARLLYLGYSAGLEGLVAENEEELQRVTEFIGPGTRLQQPKFHYQRNTVYLRFCHADYHKGAALAELSRLLEIPRAEIFAAGDHHNDISMLDGRFAAWPACPANAIPEVKAAVESAPRLRREQEPEISEQLRFLACHPEAGAARRGSRSVKFGYRKTGGTQ